MTDITNWLEVLPIVELAINYSPNRSTGYSLLFFFFFYHSIIPADLVCGNEMINNETVGKFCKRMKVVWGVASANMKKATKLQAKYYNE